MCRRWVGPGRRRGTLYCSARCRQRAYRERCRQDERDAAHDFDVPLILDDAARKRLTRELATELASMRRRYQPLGGEYVAALRREVAELAAQQLKKPWHGAS
ncbi:hypothetical protein [Mycobacterium sp. E787]|uniref:hypothetical protein n=1 Tax=Mycobacterium sp. E787 TaxID=1834150 RepID=UPI0012EA9ABA|nr:hypothetical protein [Mycobacterium sp. E787]